jgi:hypothetical protein
MKAKEACFADALTLASRVEIPPMSRLINQFLGYLMMHYQYRDYIAFAINECGEQLLECHNATSSIVNPTICNMGSNAARHNRKSSD